MAGFSAMYKVPYLQKMFAGHPFSDGPSVRKPRHKRQNAVHDDEFCSPHVQYYKDEHCRSLHQDG